MTTVAIIQARTGSTRLPGKVLADLAGRALVQWTLDSARRATRVDAVWLATSTSPNDDELADWATLRGYAVYRGPEDDVLRRFAGCAQAAKADLIVRLTADCPFMDPSVIDDVIALQQTTNADYVTNTLERGYPDGLDVEVFTRAALDRADLEAQHPFLREHVTPYISGKRRDKLPFGGFSQASLNNAQDFSHLRWTVDEPDDLDFVRAIAAELKPDFGWMDIIALLTRKPDLMRINRGHTTNEGTTLGLVNRVGRSFDRSNQAFARALESVPLASQTFSKSHQQWVRGVTPLFIEQGRGARVWDIDGNPYIDHVLGLLPVILGYCDHDVDSAIRDQLDKGIVFSLASPLEMELAERLIKLIPCAEMVRFGKNGSDVTTAAVRLARAFTGRDRVIVGGYHGWHDWSIGVTSRDLGIPPAIKALSQAVAFNDPDAIESALIADPDNIAAVIIEPDGAYPPSQGYLQRLRELTSRFGTLLIFDEIITGFRIDMGGAQARHGVIPDLAAFGKSMANGMPISAIVGRRDIMSMMEDIFFSGTFGGECLSLAAALATIDKLERQNVPATLWSHGEKLSAIFEETVARHGLGEVVGVVGEGWWPRIKWKEPPVPLNLAISLFRQETVAHGLFLAASFNLCLAHTQPAILKETTAALDATLAAFRDHLDAPDPAKRLRGRMFQPTFSVR